jgi:hypothetical protein
MTTTATMTEAALSESAIELAHLFGWRGAHFRPARTIHGWRTPVAADGAGWPDLTMVRGDRIIFAELKSCSGKLSGGRQDWLDLLSAAARHTCGDQSSGSTARSRPFCATAGRLRHEAVAERSVGLALRGDLVQPIDCFREHVRDAL